MQPIKFLSKRLSLLAPTDQLSFPISPADFNNRTTVSVSVKQRVLEKAFFSVSASESDTDYVGSYHLRRDIWEGQHRSHLPGEREYHASRKSLSVSYLAIQPVPL